MRKEGRPASRRCGSQVLLRSSPLCVLTVLGLGESQGCQNPGRRKPGTAPTLNSWAGSTWEPEVWTGHARVCMHVHAVAGAGSHREEWPTEECRECTQSQLRWGILGPNPGWSKHVRFTFQGVLNPLPSTALSSYPGCPVQPSAPPAPTLSPSPSYHVDTPSFCKSVTPTQLAIPCSFPRVGKAESVGDGVPPWVRWGKWRWAGHWLQGQQWHFGGCVVSGCMGVCVCSRPLSQPLGKGCSALLGWLGHDPGNGSF